MSGLTTLEPDAAYALWAANYPPRAHNPVMQAEERAMLALMPTALANKNVLDAGCGSGRYLLHALQHGATRLVGVDLSQEMLDRARDELSQYCLVERGSQDSSSRRRPGSSVFPQDKNWIPAFSGMTSLDERDCEPGRLESDAQIELKQGSLTALPVPDAWAEVTVCGLTIGHLDNLERALAELHRTTRPGGTIVCSDVHPIGHALGWSRDFRHEGQRYAVRHFPHRYSDWHAVCARLGLLIEDVLEPMLDPADIAAGARFDPRALDNPVALVLRLRRAA